MSGSVAGDIIVGVSDKSKLEVTSSVLLHQIFPQVLHTILDSLNVTGH